MAAFKKLYHFLKWNAKEYLERNSLIDLNALKIKTWNSSLISPLSIFIQSLEKITNTNVSIDQERSSSFEEW